jgi:hydroxymethylglutaryl-CoA reductase
MADLRSSRLPGFYDKTQPDRAAVVAEWAGLSAKHKAAIDGTGGLTPEGADHMIENVVGLHNLPLGVAVNFMVNSRDVLVPMAIEEPSVVAGASFMAKLVRDGGGFHAHATEPLMIGQMQIIGVPDLHSARMALLEKKGRILELANQIDPVLIKAGGGARDLEVRLIDDSPIGPFLVAHLIYDTRDAMGANAVNTACETLAPTIEQITGGRVHLRILSNLADRRLARAHCTIPVSALAFGRDDPAGRLHPAGRLYTGEQVRDGIIEAYAFAAADPYRAATHNKGIMNGVDAVVIATGNDWRAIEAGAHSYAARSGRYTSLSTWGKDKDGNLAGTLEMPMAVGIVGGATKVHPTAQTALKLLGVTTARELAEIIVSVGLAQNLAAIRALATEGIQRGHMTLHARQVAIAAGAVGSEVEVVAGKLVAEKKVRIDRAEAVLREIRELEIGD